MSTGAQQNAMMLASLLGVDEAGASERLKRTVLLTAEPGWKAAWAREVGKLIGLTVQVVFEPSDTPPDLELLIGAASNRTAAKCLFADLGATAATVSYQPVGSLFGAPHGLHAAAVACLAAAAAISAVVDDSALPAVRLPLHFAYSQLGIPDGALTRPVELGDAVLAGAGAVAHGFLKAARHLDVRGELAVVDPKVVQRGVLNRCRYLREADVGSDKAIALAERAQSDFPNLRLRPHVSEFKGFLRGRARPPETVFVTVDSRRARRSIQLEVPHRVIDASTTDVRGVVVHSNLLPTAGACLACIYRHVPEEHERERFIAEGLGIELDQVRRGFIDAESAGQIVLTHQTIDPTKIVGLAFDSLYRQLCSEQALATPGSRQVLAPFAFVSAWAGVLMVVETLRSFAGATGTNYWSVDPWNLPVARARTFRPRSSDCQFCSMPECERVVAELWGEAASTR